MCGRREAPDGSRGPGGVILPGLAWLRVCEDLVRSVRWRPLNTGSCPVGCRGWVHTPDREARERRPGTEALGSRGLASPLAPHGHQAAGNVGLSLTRSHARTRATRWPCPTVGVVGVTGTRPGPLNNGRRLDQEGPGQTSQDGAGTSRLLLGGPGPVGVLPSEGPADAPPLLSHSQSHTHCLSRSLSLARSQPREGGAHLPTSRNQGNRS